LALQQQICASMSDINTTYTEKWGKNHLKNIEETAINLSTLVFIDINYK
jgi:hypothetical protein